MKQVLNLGTGMNMPIPTTAARMERNKEVTPRFALANPWRLTSLTGSAYSQTSAEHRKAAADVLNAHLLMVEIMMSNITQRYIYKVIDELKEKGLMRHNIKRRAKALQNLSDDLMKRCNTHDSMQVQVFTRNIFPSLTGLYIAEGGTLTQKMQSLFVKQYDSELSRIFCATKNALDKAKIKESGLASNVEMILLLAHSGIDLYNYICRKVDALLAGIGSVTRIKSQHNEQIIGAAKDLLRELGCQDKSMPEKETKDVRTLAAQFQQNLVSEDLLQMIESSIVALQIDYTEFVIASLRKGYEPKRNDLKSLLLRLGTKANIRRLLKEILEIPIREDFEGDIFDLMDELPANIEGTALSDFRRLCMKDHILTEPETKHEIRMRKQRQEVYRNGGVLELDYLKYLYFRMETKKAVHDYIAEAGEVMHRSLILLKKTKADVLRLDPHATYRLSLGNTVKALRMKKKWSELTLASSLGADTGQIRQIEEIEDVSPFWGSSLKRVIFGLAGAFGISPAYLLFKCLEKTNKEGITLSAFRSRIESIGKDELTDTNKNETNKNNEQEDGKENEKRTT